MCIPLYFYFIFEFVFLLFFFLSWRSLGFVLFRLFSRYSCFFFVCYDAATWAALQRVNSSSACRDAVIRNRDCSSGNTFSFSASPLQEPNCRCCNRHETNGSFTDASADWDTYRFDLPRGGWAPLTPEEANKLGWHVRWVAVPENSAVAHGAREHIWFDTETHHPSSSSIYWLIKKNGRILDFCVPKKDLGVQIQGFEKFVIGNLTNS